MNTGNNVQGVKPKNGKVFDDYTTGFYIKKNIVERILTFSINLKIINKRWVLLTQKNKRDMIKLIKSGSTILNFIKK